jgi:hypothetical protein
MCYYNQDQAIDSERKRVGTHLLYSGGVALLLYHVGAGEVTGKITIEDKFETNSRTFCITV